MAGRVYWWTCPPPRGCLDQMRPSSDPEQVKRDRDAHIASHHGDYDYSELELRLSSWHESDYA